MRLLRTLSVFRAPNGTFYVRNDRQVALLLALSTNYPCPSYEGTGSSRAVPDSFGYMQILQKIASSVLLCLISDNNISENTLILYHMSSDRVSLFEIIGMAQITEMVPAARPHVCVQNLQSETQIQLGMPQRNLRISVLMRRVPHITTNVISEVSGVPGLRLVIGGA